MRRQQKKTLGLFQYFSLYAFNAISSTSEVKQYFHTTVINSVVVSPSYAVLRSTTLHILDWNHAPGPVSTAPALANIGRNTYLPHPNVQSPLRPMLRLPQTKKTSKLIVLGAALRQIFLPSGP